jgi:hypothetical protein
MDRPTFFTDYEVFSDKVDRLNFDHRFALLIESQSIYPHMYEDFDRVASKFKKIFTHNSKLLERYDNARWIPGGGVWANEINKNGEGFNKKDKNISFLSSRKLNCKMHLLRFILANILKKFSKQVDVFIPNSIYQNYSVGETLDKYRYSVVIENHISDLYFTEKVLNCFASRTIPIYLGAKKINNYFDVKGIVVWSDLVKLIYDKNFKLDEAFYLKRKSSIDKNEELVKSYYSLEDYIYLNYMDSK